MRSMIWQGRAGRALLGLGLAVLPAIGMAAPAVADTGLRAGAGRADIAVLPAMLPLQDFDYVRDPIQVRVTLLDNGKTRVALVVLDLTAIMGPHIDSLKQTVGQVAGVDPANVWIVASHTFSSPHAPVPGQQGPFTGRTPEEAVKATAYRAAVDDAAARAARQATGSLRDAEVGFGTTRSFINVNRNIETAEGWWQGNNDELDSDRTVGVLRIDDTRHQPIAVLMNYAVQPSVMARAKIGGKAPITADIAGAASRYVEGQYGGDTVSMFLVGAAGDQGPAYAARRQVPDKDGKIVQGDVSDQASVLIDLQGERLGDAVVKASQRIVTAARPVALGVTNATVEVKTQDRPKELFQIKPSKTYEYNVNGKTQAPFTVMRIGDVALVGVQVELASSVGEYIKAHSPFRNTMVVTMVNGGAKYLPAADAYKMIQYQAMNASYAAGSAEIMAKAILAQLNAINRQRAK
jgi:neutral ceramidase